MQTLKYNKKPRKTKRQLKLLNGANEIVKSSIETGKKIGEYIGLTPTYKNIAPIGNLEKLCKINCRIPFVKPSNFNL